VRSAPAHLWFITLHPYEDGNGRIGRAIADLALARDEGSSRRLYSMSVLARAPGEGKNTRYVLRGYDIDVSC
jgi:Fic family protein